MSQSAPVKHGPRPPIAGRGRPSRFDWASLTAPLLDSPGEWFTVLEQVPRSLATTVRSRSPWALRRDDGVFEAVTRNQHGKNADLLMRWVPNNKEDDAPAGAGERQGGV